MSEARTITTPSGERFAVLVIDKETGITSHDIVRAVRKIADEPRAGHTGTLDPFASGVLVICLGVATRLSEYFLGHDKRYLATIEFGVETETYDRDGAITKRQPVEFTRDRLSSALDAFRGTIEQVPPAWSALRVEGKRAHSLARKGIPVDLKPRSVTVRSLDLVEYTAPRAVLDITCSTGTYVRSIAHDLGRALGCGAHLSELRRLRSGAFTIDDAITLDALKEAAANRRVDSLLLPPTCGLQDLLEVRVDAKGAAMVDHGHAVPIPAASGAIPGSNCRIHDATGTLIAMGFVTEAGMAQPKKVLR